MRTLPVVAALVLTLSSTLAAQREAPYGPVAGTRVRVSAPALDDRLIYGRVVALGGDSLVLAASSGVARTRIPVIEVQRIEASRGRDRFMYALRGAGIGAVVGLVAGGFAARDSDAGMAGIAFIFIGGALGVPVGAAAGALAAPERWQVAWRAEDVR